MKQDATRDLDDFTLDDSVPYLMIRVSGLMNRQLELDLRPLKVSFQHWRVLAVLVQKNGSSPCTGASCPWPWPFASGLWWACQRRKKPACWDR